MLKKESFKNRIDKILNYKSIWISDLHLGTRGCQSELLLEFIRHTQSEKLYLVGDIVDGWALYIASPNFIEEVINCCVLVLISSVLSDLIASLRSSISFSIAFLSASEILLPCSFKLCSVDAIKASA